jgi:hypothetical protein
MATAPLRSRTMAEILSLSRSIGAARPLFRSRLIRAGIDMIRNPSKFVSPAAITLSGR